MFWPANLISPEYASVFSGSYLYFLTATAMGWSSPVLPKLENITTTPFDRPITITEGSWISSLVLLGATVGPSMFTLISDVIGRKNALLSLGVPSCFAHVLMASVWKVEAFYVARFLLGLSLGGAFSLFTMYIGEVANKSNRGRLSTMMSALVNFGFLLTYTIGPLITVLTFNIILAVIPLVFSVPFFLFGEETAHFWMLKGEEAKAKDVLRRLRPAEGDIEAEMLEIKQKIKEQREGSVLDVLKSRTFIRGFVMAGGLSILQPFTGIYVMLMYGQTIFYMTGSTLEPAICTIILGFVQFSSSLTTPILVGRFSRKTLLMGSAAGMVIVEIPMGIYCYLDVSEHSSWRFFPILALALFMLSYNNGFGPLPWMILSEVFPTRVKTIAFSIITSINLAIAFLLTKYFTIFVDTIGLDVAFWVFGSCSFLALIFVHFFVLETKGKTLEEIQDDFRM